MDAETNDKRDHAPREEDRREDDDEKDKAPPPKPMSPARRRLLIGGGIVLLLVIIIAGTLYYLHARRFESTDDAFIDGHISQVASQVPGHITALLVADNQRVIAGQALLQIDPRDTQVRLIQARAQQGTATAQVAQAQAQFAVRQAGLDQSNADHAVAKADDEHAHSNLERYQRINPQAITQQQLDDAVAAARTADARLEAAGQAIAAAAAQIKAAQAQQAAAQAGLQQADADAANAELQLSYTHITAPAAGRVAKRTAEVGNYVTPGQALLAIVQDDLWVTANFKETQLALMRPGQHVAVTVDAVPGTVFSAHIDSFQRGTGSVFSALPAENATGNYVKVVQRVPVRIVFDDPDQVSRHLLAPGMSVDPEVTVRP